MREGISNLVKELVTEIQELIGKITLPKVQSVLKIVAFIVGFLFVLSDMCRGDDGYLRPIFSFLIGFLSDAINIINTPLASLTIGNILCLAIYFWFGRFILMFCIGAIFSWRGNTPD